MMPHQEALELNHLPWDSQGSSLKSLAWCSCTLKLRIEPIFSLNHPLSQRSVLQWGFSWSTRKAMATTPSFWEADRRVSRNRNSSWPASSLHQLRCSSAMILHVKLSTSDNHRSFWKLPKSKLIALNLVALLIDRLASAPEYQQVSSWSAFLKWPL